MHPPPMYRQRQCEMSDQQPNTPSLPPADCCLCSESGKDKLTNAAKVSSLSHSDQVVQLIFRRAIVSALPRKKGVQ